jgi:SAM-dependent methyltransferase
VVKALGLQPEASVLDVGAGTGALLPVIRSVAPAARVVALDASAEMLRVARRRGGKSVICADAAALPITHDTMDAAILAYVLFHLEQPSRALTEALRALRTGGRLATVTWAWERGSSAHALWDTMLKEAEVPPLTTRRVDTDLDSPDAVQALLLAAGALPQRIWLEQLHHRWDPVSFWELATGSGVNRTRLALVDAATRADLSWRLRHHLDELAADDFRWEGEVICAIATKKATGE